MEQVIHQVWYQGERDCPVRYLDARREWQRLHPDFRYMFWDRHSLDSWIGAHYPEYHRAWRALDKDIKKCDAARCLLLHHFGGVYADCDTVPFRPMPELVANLDLSDFEVVLSEESHDILAWKARLNQRVHRRHGLTTIVGNAIMLGLQRGSDFWIDFLDAAFLRRDRSVLESFSTWHLSRFLDHFEHNDRVAVIPGGHLLDTTPQGEETYAVHAYDAAWFDYSKPCPWEG